MERGLSAPAPRGGGAVGGQGGAPGLSGLGDVVGVLLGQPTALQPHRKATIHILRGSEWDRYLQAHRENELCGAISLAGTILHEMWHVVRDWHWGDSLPGADYCFPPYYLENLFRLALHGQCGARSPDNAKQPFINDIFSPACPLPEDT